MQFQFESLDAFIAMKGHGPYVWACYVITYTALIYLVTAPLLQKKALLTQIKKLHLLQKNTDKQN